MTFVFLYKITSNSDGTVNVKCDEGYHFTNGFSEETFTCKRDLWLSKNDNSPLDQSFKCEPICEIHCQNGGVCIKPNICSCPKEYIGNICQYQSCLTLPKMVNNTEISIR